MNDEVNYYDLLGISPTATDEEIKQAYKNMIKKWHPDINKDPNASKMSVILNEAKTVLLDKIKRKEYDDYLQTKTSKTYENIKKHTTKNDSTSYQPKDNKYSYTEEKTYTKWEYYRDYMKYYKASIWYKILVTIGVFTESAFCGLLQILNLILAYVFCALYNILEYLMNYILGLIILLILFNIFSGNLSGFKDYFNIALIFILSLAIITLPQVIISFLTEKMPIYLSNLNIFLFKKCVGYKN